MISPSSADRDELIKEFSFDVHLMHRRIDAGDDFQKVIQAHLFVDHILGRFLSEELKHPDKISIERMTVGSKAELIMAMGLLPDGMYRPFKRLNRLRNQIAHDLSFIINDIHSKEIYDLFPAELRSLVNEAEVAKSNSRLGQILKVYVVTLDAFRQIRGRAREAEKIRLEKLQAAVAEARSIIQIIDQSKA